MDLEKRNFQYFTDVFLDPSFDWNRRTPFSIENGTLITHSYTLQTRTRYLFCLCYSSCLKGVESDSAHFPLENGGL